MNTPDDVTQERVLELLAACTGPEERDPDIICELWDIAASSPENVCFMHSCKAAPILMNTALKTPGRVREVSLGTLHAMTSSMLSSTDSVLHKAGSNLCNTKELAQLCVLIALSDTDTPTLCEVCGIALNCLAASSESQGLWLTAFTKKDILNMIVFWIRSTRDTQLIACASKLAYSLSYYDSKDKRSVIKHLLDEGFCDTIVEVFEDNITCLAAITKAIEPLLSFFLLSTEIGLEPCLSKKSYKTLEKVSNLIKGDPEFEAAEKIMNTLLELADKQEHRPDKKKTKT